MVMEQPIVIRVFLALCGRLWTEQQALIPLPAWQELPQLDREAISLAGLLTVQEMIRLQKEEYSTLINARAVLPRIWDEHYFQPPEGGMPLWQEMTSRQQQALTLIAQCVATECECAIIDAGEA